MDKNNSNNKEPEFWTILKTPPKTKKQLEYEFWTKILADDVYRGFVFQDYLTICK